MPSYSSACDFMMGLGKSQLRAKFKVASPSRCRNITGELKNIWELPKPTATLIVLWVLFYDGPWQTQAVYQI